MTEHFTMSPEVRREILLASIVGRIDGRVRPKSHAAVTLLAALQAGVDPGDLSIALDAVLAEIEKSDERGEFLLDDDEDDDEEASE